MVVILDHTGIGRQHILAVSYINMIKDGIFHGRPICVGGRYLYAPSFSGGSYVGICGEWGSYVGICGGHM